VAGAPRVTALGTPPRISPYVGPRAFKYGEHLFGRDREIAELVDLLISERVVLLYSPSGAGKSSLLQAGLQPQLERERFTVLPTIRVTHELRPGAGHGVPRNRYVLSTLLSLEEGVAKEQQLPTDALVHVGLADELDRLRALGRAGNADERHHECLVFDQFEELLTTDATDEAAKAAFMAEVGEVLRDRQRWAIFAMREDFVAALDPYLGYLPTRLRARYRLDLLRQHAARLAVARPAEEIGVHIDPDAVGKLVDDLRRVRVQSLTGITEEPGPYVEPVQLQVVCLRLLKPGVDHVSAADVAALGDVDNALTDYYDGTVAAVAAETGVTERAIRDWFGGELITDQGLRAQVLRGPHGDANGGALERLESAHLIRAETRRGARWYELAHDRLVDPVRTSNAATMTPLQREASYWDEQGRPDGLLRGGAVLADAQTWATAQDDELTRAEREFLEASHRQESDRQRTVTAARRNRRIAIGMSVVGVLAVVGLLLALVLWRQAEDLKDTNARLSSTYVWRSIAQSPDATPRQNVGATLAALAARPPEAEADRELTGLARNALYNAERSGYNDQTFALSSDGHDRRDRREDCRRSVRSPRRPRSPRRGDAGRRRPRAHHVGPGDRPAAYNRSSPASYQRPGPHRLRGERARRGCHRPHRVDLSVGRRDRSDDQQSDRRRCDQRQRLRHEWRRPAAGLDRPAGRAEPPQRRDRPGRHRAGARRTPVLGYARVQSRRSIPRRR
jgi:Novel STAND NTPase 1